MSDEIVEFWRGLSRTGRQQFLAALSHFLTVVTRGSCYPAAAPEITDKERIQIYQGINELSHSVTGQLQALLFGAVCYPDDVFWGCLNDKARYYKITSQLDYALKFVKENIVSQIGFEG